MSRGFDAIVIGGGVIGTSVAYFLARGGLRVCLLERGAIASGTSSASAGHTSVSGRVPGPMLELALANIRLLARLQDELETDFEYVESGGLTVAENAAEYRLLRRFYERQRAHVPLEWLEQGDVRKREPNLAPTILGGTYCPLDGYVNPMLLARALATGAQRLGAEIRTQTEAKGLVTSGERVTGVKAEHETILAGVVVSATGVWSDEFGRLAGLRVPVVPRKGELIVTEPLPPLVHGILSHAGHIPFAEHGIETPPGVEGEMSKKRYLKQVRSGGFKGRFYVGSTTEFRGFDRTNTWAGITQLAAYAVEMVPALRHARLVRSWAGLRPRSRDGKFLIGGVPALRNFYVATGHDSIGVLYSQTTGQLLAEYIITGVRPRLLEPFDPARLLEPAVEA
jgi:glycine/D-amino acid oxidase-like deaminating enzyme